jgi:hypothetical protein
MWTHGDFVHEALLDRCRRPNELRRVHVRLALESNSDRGYQSPTALHTRLAAQPR